MFAGEEDLAESNGGARTTATEEASDKPVGQFPVQAPTISNVPIMEVRPHKLIRKPSFPASPTKGILLTPGTTATRRKTVSFIGAHAIDATRKDVNAGEEDRSNLDGRGGSPPSASLNPAEEDENVRRRLFVDRDDREAAQVTRNSGLASFPYKEDPSSPKVHQSMSNDNLEVSAETTIDLGKPRSLSGKHWKKEYERDHDKSKTEMRKLIRHTQIAKSYAARKDAELMELTEKLRRSESQMQEMEGRVRGIASKIGAHPQQSHDGTGSMGSLMDELATYMAQALRYKQKAERYKLALEEQDILGKLEDTKGDVESGHRGPRVDDARRTILGSDSDEMEVIYSEMTELKKECKAIELRAESLSTENDQLKHTLARVKDEMRNYEIRHQAWDERRQRKDAKSTAQKQALRNEITQLKQEYKTELENVKAEAAVEQRALMAEIEKLKQSLASTRQSKVIDEPLFHPKPRIQARKIIASSKRGQQYRTSVQPLASPLKELVRAVSSKHSLSQSPLDGDGMAQLAMALGSEPDLSLTNAALSDHPFHPPPNLSSYAATHTPTFDLSKPPSSVYDLENLDTSDALPGRARIDPATVRARPASPTAAPLLPPLRSSRGKNVFGGSSRASSLVGNSSRVELPPERIAAAKLRIEQRRRTRELGKENQSPS